MQAAEAVRERMGQDFQLKTLWIVPKSDIMTTLVNSGYSTTEALSSNDARALAQLLRAEEYVEGNVEKTGTGYRVTANMMLVRPDGMVQPLPPVDVAKVGDAAKGISNAVEAARKQIDPTKKCIDLYRAKKYAEAIAEAKKGIAVYPNAVMPRVCIAEVYNDQKLGADSMIAISESILKIHKDNKRALAFAADAYAEKKMEDKQIEALTRLISLDPNNTRLQTQVVNILAASGKASLALPIVDDAVKNNPGDASLVHLQWLVHFAAKDIKGALGIGEEMVKLDTASADTTFFIRQAAAYAADSQFKKAAETLARGRQKFPNNMSISATYVQLLIQTGQTAQAIEVAKGIAQGEPEDSGYLAADREGAVGRGRAAGHGDGVAPKRRLRQATARDSLRRMRRASDRPSRRRPRPRTRKTSTASVAHSTYLQFTDSVQKSAAAAFLQGATHLQKGQALLEQARDKKSCDMAKEATQDFTDAQIFIPRGAAEFRDQAGQLMTRVAAAVAVRRPDGESAL